MLRIEFFAIFFGREQLGLFGHGSYKSKIPNVLSHFVGFFQDSFHSPLLFSTAPRAIAAPNRRARFLDLLGATFATILANSGLLSSSVRLRGRCSAVPLVPSARPDSGSFPKPFQVHIGRYPQQLLQRVDGIDLEPHL